MQPLYNSSRLLYFLTLKENSSPCFCVCWLFSHGGFFSHLVCNFFVVNFSLVKVKSEVAQSCPTLCDPMDCSLPCSSVHGIFQAGILEWGAISFFRGSSWPRNQTQVSCIARDSLSTADCLHLPLQMLYQLSYKWSPKMHESQRIEAFKL